MLEQTNEILNHIKKEKPLILNITNDVTMDLIANGLLSLGASPVMSKAEQEMEDLVQHAKAVVINIGTLNESFIALCKRACSAANQFNKPIILDPVGAGASQYRTDVCTSLLNEFDITLVRGNASEIMALSGSSNNTKGVDNTINSHDALEHAIAFSQQWDLTVVISGKTDILVDHHLMTQLERGSSLMPMMTGTGCLLTAVIAAFLAVETNRFKAATLATLFYGICGEIAEKKSQGPGSFKTQFLDALSFLPDRDQYEKH